MRWRLLTILVAAACACGPASALTLDLGEAEAPAQPQVALPTIAIAVPVADARIHVTALVPDAPPAPAASVPLDLAALQAPSTAAPADAPLLADAPAAPRARDAPPAPLLAKGARMDAAGATAAEAPPAPLSAPGPGPAPSTEAAATPRAFAPPGAGGLTASKATLTVFAGGLLALLGVALYHRIRPNSTLENDTRKTIFQAVCDQPGLGVHAIAERAGVSYSTATYHLERLIAAGMIVMTPDGNKLCYYKNGGAFTETERKILPLLKNDEASRLLDAILETPGTYRAALAERLGVTATTINWHLKRLRDAGLVRETREGRNAYLFVNEQTMHASMGTLAQKVGHTDPAVAARLRRYSPPSASS